MKQTIFSANYIQLANNFFYEKGNPPWIKNNGPSLNHPISRLYPLEVAESNSESNIEHFDVKPKENIRVQPIRNAALNADLIRRLRNEEDDC